MAWVTIWLLVSGTILWWLHISEQVGQELLPMVLGSLMLGAAFTGMVAATGIGRLFSRRR